MAPLELERPAGVSLGFHRALLGRLEADALDLPRLDEPTARVVGLAADPGVGVEEAAAALEACPELAARVLEVAGSAFYATREPARDVRAAAARLGMRAVGELAIVALVRDELYEPLLGTSEAEELWRHAAVAGVYAHRLTRRRGRASEASLLAGLMADIGRPLVLGLLLELEAALGEELPPSTRRVLVDALHVAVGTALVRAWNLPRSVVLAVTYHHALDQAPAGCEDAAIACLCDHLARRLFQAHEEEDLADHPAARALGLTEEDLDELLADPAEVLEAARALG